MTVYNNTLDTWYSNCHWAIQEVLRTPYEKASEWLRWVTGDPNKVAGEGPTYEAIGQEVMRLGTQLRETATGISGWEGSAHDNFLMTMGRLEETASKIAPAIQQTTEILRAAAETSVEAANMILDIIKSVIEFLVSSLAIAAATSLFTFGASFGAWIAANLAKGAHALAKIMQGLTKVAQVLEKIASALKKIAELMKKLAELLKTLKELLKMLKELKKLVGLKGKAVIAVANGLLTAPVKFGANQVLDGATAITGAEVNMPSGVGTAKSAAENAWDAYSASERAVDAATGVSP